VRAAPLPLSVARCDSKRTSFRYDDTTLDVALNQFQANKSHISLVQRVDNTDPDRDPFPVTTGVVTMEVGSHRLFLRARQVLAS
jgi:hypothetical protein